MIFDFVTTVTSDFADIINTTNRLLALGKLQYYYQDTIDFICDEKFVKLNDTPVTCLSNRTWSIYRQCVEISEYGFTFSNICVMATNQSSSLLKTLYGGLFQNG